MYKFNHLPDFLLTFGVEWTPQTAALEEMGEEKQVEGMFQVGHLPTWLLRHRQGRADQTHGPPVVKQRQE